MKIIKVDVDCVIADLVTEWLARYNARYDDPIEQEELQGYHFSKMIKYPDKFHDILTETDLYDYVQPEPGAIEGVRRLREETGARIIFVTACYATQYDQKLIWLNRHGILSDKRDYYGAHDKTLIRGDLMIDDYEGNFGHYDPVKVLFGKPWNRNPNILEQLKLRFHPDRVFRVRGWQDFNDEFYDNLRRAYKDYLKHYDY